MKRTLIVAALALMFFGACELAEPEGLVRTTGPQPGLLYADGDFWYGLRNWEYSGSVAIRPDLLHNVDSFCVVRRGAWIRYSGPSYRVLDADTIELAGNYCYLTNYSWWTGSRMNFTLKLFDAQSALIFQTNGVVVGDLWTQQNVHNFTAPAGTASYELTYWTDEDSSMVDGCVLRQYPNQTPPPPPPPPPPPQHVDTLWALASRVIPKRATVRYSAIPVYDASTVTLKFSVAGQVNGKLAWDNATSSSFSMKDGRLSQSFAVPSGVQKVSIYFTAKSRGAVTLTNALLLNGN